MAALGLSNLEGSVNCDISAFDDARTAYYAGYAFLETNIYISRRCIDCTERVEGATKTKPDYWPNDHQ
jgi:hypothetical protein